MITAGNRLERRSPLHFPIYWTACCAIALFSGLRAKADEFAAISSRASKDYVRAHLPNGTFQAETYAFGKGGYWTGSSADKTIDAMNFMDVARTIAGSLQTQSYLPCKDPKATKLLIMVYWGTTRAPEHATESVAYQNMVSISQKLNMLGVPVADPSAALRNPAAQSLDTELTNVVSMAMMENRQRDKANRQNAEMLGYNSWWDATASAQPATALQHYRNDMLDELEENRYFVVLMAYDFQMLWKQKKKKLLWETRFSISEHRNAFDQQLAAMALAASKHFGQDSHGLLHRAVTEGHVEMGELKSLGVEADKK